MRSFANERTKPRHLASETAYARGMHGPLRDAFRAAALASVAAVRELPRDESAWSAPGLGEWSVRSLVGHLSRAFVTVVDYSGAPEPDAATIATAGEYVARARLAAASPGVAQRGVDAGIGLGSTPAAAAERYAELAAAAMDAVDRVPAGRRVAVFGGSMRFDEYLRTRILELVVHGLDLAAAVPGTASPDQDDRMPDASTPAAASGSDPAEDVDARAVEHREAAARAQLVALTVLAESAVSLGGSAPETLLRALTGRAGLPAGFSVV